MKNPFKKYSLPVTLFISFIAISAVLIALLGATSYYITTREVVDETISSRVLLLGEINKQIDYQLQAIEYDALVVASNPTIRQYLEEPEQSFDRIRQNDEVIDLLSRYSYVKHAIHSVQLYANNSTGNVYRGANGIFSRAFIDHSPTYPEIEHTDAAWLGTHALEVGDYLSMPEPVISYYRKVWSASGKELGILVFNMKLASMNELISADAVDGSRYVVDARQRLIVEAHPAGAEAPDYETIRSDLATTLQDRSVDHRVTVHEDGKQLLIWREQPRTQWVVMDRIPWDRITEGSRQIQQTIVLTIVLCVLLAIGMAWLLAGQFAVPIRRLVRVMAKLKGGKMDSRVANEYENEFGYLNQHFNTMADEIEGLIRQVNLENQQKREAELKVLQEQMNPHFLYNTLDTMNWHAISIGATEISHMLSLLGKMMRIGLSSGKAFITVAAEAEHLGCYVELQKIRCKGRIDFRIDIDESLQPYAIPKITLQPLVENAIIHGFHSRREGRIVITGRQQGELMKLSVQDNGYGFSPDNRRDSSSQHGLHNVRERIRLYYGPQYGLDIQSEPNVSTVVTLTLPLVRESGDDRRLQEGEESDHD
ncbi:two-component sensor histidine kinase [Paenibacillus sp. 598K]|uniref:cache domain-containing sensor histidine kinase n=1 Tax=Paenibacillus sp. 598K TaxID=1117987 RepID=UPI000FFA76AA|nr:sensor histidine kinase [Paenibacillus sp. 598K]GBF78171.1 two-component sensor histidine kinase [Paenibacillus sp. 598K]